jgi:glutamate synthase domain-containing protein 3
MHIRTIDRSVSLSEMFSPHRYDKIGRVGLFDHWIMRHPPGMTGIVHHQIDKNGQEETKQGATIADLSAVDGAVECRAAVHQLIAQHVKPVKQDRQDGGCVLTA